MKLPINLGICFSRTGFSSSGGDITIESKAHGTSILSMKFKPRYLYYLAYIRILSPNENFSVLAIQQGAYILSIAYQRSPIQVVCSSSGCSERLGSIRKGITLVNSNLRPRKRA